MADDGALSPREQQVWALLAQGLSNKEIANQLGLAVGTVKTYLHRLYRKLRVSSRVEAALAYGARWGLAQKRAPTLGEQEPVPRREDEAAVARPS